MPNNNSNNENRANNANNMNNSGSENAQRVQNAGNKSGQNKMQNSQNKMENSQNKMENSKDARADICANMEFFGIAIDAEKNNVRGEECAIHADGARVQVWVVPTNEELSIAEDVVNVVETLS